MHGNGKLTLALWEFSYRGQGEQLMWHSLIPQGSGLDHTPIPAKVSEPLRAHWQELKEGTGCFPRLPGKDVFCLESGKSTAGSWESEERDQPSSPEGGVKKGVDT